jgi:Holliday junction resolvase RusA-like endonuclease
VVRGGPCDWRHRDLRSVVVAVTSITIIIPGKPQGKARPRFTRTGHVYTPAKTRQYELDIRTCAFKAAGRGWNILEGPIGLDFKAVFPIPKSWSKAKGVQAMFNQVMPTTKPDADNILKAAMDGLNATIYKDDKQVVLVSGRKCYGLEPRLELTVREI